MADEKTGHENIAPQGAPPVVSGTDMPSPTGPPKPQPKPEDEKKPEDDQASKK